MPCVLLCRRFLTRKALEFSIVFIRIVYELAPVIVETAAFKASRSLASRLLVSEPECDLVKAVFSLFCRENAHPFARDMFSVRKVALVYFAFDKYRFFVADNIAAKITVNNRYALLRFTYSGYGYVCALVCASPIAKMPFIFVLNVLSSALIVPREVLSSSSNPLSSGL